MKTQTTVKARVYIARREKSSARLRARIIGGIYEGLAVSCARAMREAWRPGDILEFTGSPVSPGTTAAYFRATHTGRPGDE